MKRILTAAAITLGLLTGSANAGVSCDERMIIEASANSQEISDTKSKVMNMVRKESDDLLQASDKDRASKAQDLAKAVIKATEAAMGKPVGAYVKRVAKEQGAMISGVLASVAEVKKASTKPGAGSLIERGVLPSIVGVVAMAATSSCNK